MKACMLRRFIEGHPRKETLGNILTIVAVSLPRWSERLTRKISRLNAINVYA
jgi:hypothetical protein